MSDYRNSDYALNKFSEGIVYQFSGEIRVVTIEDYLKENPDKTEEDFRELKELSDQIYHGEKEKIIKYRKYIKDLIPSVLEAQTAARYMDWKAGLITELEYLKTAGSAKMVKVKEPELER